MTTKQLEKKVEVLRKQRKAFMNAQDEGKDFHGYRNAGNIEIAINHIEKAIHYINLSK